MYGQENCGGNLYYGFLRNMMLRNVFMMCFLFATTLFNT